MTQRNVLLIVGLVLVVLGIAALGSSTILGVVFLVVGIGVLIASLGNVGRLGGRSQDGP